MFTCTSSSKRPIWSYFSFCCPGLSFLSPSPSLLLNCFLKVLILCSIPALVFCRITSLYIGSVFVISQFIRRLAFLNASYTIMFDELPDVDPIFELLWNICIARELKEFRLEEDLFAGLLFLFRSPETMIRFTKLRKLVKFKGDWSKCWTISRVTCNLFLNTWKMVPICSYSDPFFRQIHFNLFFGKFPFVPKLYNILCNCSKLLHQKILMLPQKTNFCW